MDDKILKRLQRKFFYVPVTLGWVFIILACILIFGISYTQSIAQVENSLLKAQARPYFDSVNNDKFIYIFVDEGKLSPLYLEDAFTEEEINEVIEKITEGKIVGNKFSTKSGKRYMFEKSISRLTEKETVKYVLIDYTDTHQTLSTLAATLGCISVISMMAILAFYYFYAAKAIQPVKQSFARQQELIANASHELKTPLTIVRTNLELIGSDPSATVEDNKKWLESAEYQVGRMHTLILDMLELTKFEATNTSVERTPLEVNDIVEGMMLSFEATCYEKSISLSFSARETLKVIANKTEIEKLTSILLDNAIKYTPHGGKIKVDISRQRKNVVLSFYNTGEGISPEDIKNIFNRFFKADLSHKETSNSFGLGLSIAQSIVQSLKGDITCESQVGQYTKFIVELPKYTETEK
ncbi:MAG: HAMP domain-containing histidine kinase [Clostridia bacterium]|nr:HAMP domain-containing histidine kinase [Clostridia bacterium]MDE7328217.1 HAMP domain-containing histidine kinase [Clostridia bacterium]